MVTKCCAATLIWHINGDTAQNRNRPKKSRKADTLLVALMEVQVRSVLLLAKV